MLSVAFSLLPASIIAFICGERERNLKHLQLISGMSLGSYWTVNCLTDLIRVAIVVGGAIGLIWEYNLGVNDIWIALLAYPFAIIPYTYVASFFFSKEATA